MRLTDYLNKILGLAETVLRWQEALRGLDRGRRERVARYVEAVADTLRRAGDALVELKRSPASPSAARRAVRELSRISGYVETIVVVLDDHLDGRKLAGVKRRLDDLAAGQPLADPAQSRSVIAIDRVASAEGYLRALADALRT